MYDGEWKNDMKHGQGKYYWPNIEIYHEGQWTENKRNGHAIATYPDGGRYEGNFVDNHRSGQGTFSYRDGSSYSGNWVNDLKDGEGEYNWPD